MGDKCQLRREKILARESLNTEERRNYSAAIVQRLTQLPEYQAAETVMLYRAVKGEVSLQGLSGKRFVWPLCIGEGEMIALLPADESAWQKGYCGIPEPVRERSGEIAPEEIDLVICPCTAFDARCQRMGMGKGFYDRFLPRCKKARFVEVAFEAQKTESLPVTPWDVTMDAVVTEKEVYRR
ncbi:MAG: 5-formyltetrahydrofolate cyclo-ligase [Candidatus Limivicinus sp.]